MSGWCEIDKLLCLVIVTSFLRDAGVIVNNGYRTIQMTSCSNGKMLAHALDLDLVVMAMLRTIWDHKWTTRTFLSSIN